MQSDEEGYADPEAELTLLGYLLRQPELNEKLFDLLEPDYFSSEVARTLFIVMRLHERCERISLRPRRPLGQGVTMSLGEEYERLIAELQAGTGFPGLATEYACVVLHLWNLRNTQSHRAVH